MSRRQAVRVVLFERGRLIGTERAVRCALTDLSASGASLSVGTRLPSPPLRLEFRMGDDEFSLELELERVVPGGRVAVRFLDPPSDRLHHLLATEQRRALAAGRVPVRERRSRGSGGTSRSS